MPFYLVKDMIKVSSKGIALSRDDVKKNVIVKLFIDSNVKYRLCRGKGKGVFLLICEEEKQEIKDKKGG